VDPGLLDAAEQGKKLSMLEILEAQQKRGALGAHMNLFHRDYDLLLTPALSITAFDAGKDVADTMLQKRWTDWTPFSYPFNLTQQPAASVPCGLTRAGLPAGLQIVGPALRRRIGAARRARFRVGAAFALPDLHRL